MDGFMGNLETSGYGLLYYDENKGIFQTTDHWVLAQKASQSLMTPMSNFASGCEKKRKLSLQGKMVVKSTLENQWMTSQRACPVFFFYSIL